MASISIIKSIFISLYFMKINDNLLSTLFFAMLMAVFVFDLMTPPGVAAGTPYGIVVLCTLWIKRIQVTYVVAVLGILLTILGFYLSPEIVSSMTAVLINRTLAVIIITSSAFLVIQRKNADKKIAKLSILSTTDHLTQVKNRLSFDRKLQHEVTRGRRYKRHFSLALVDIDDFKTINDTYGHDQGDHAIKRVCNEMIASVRQSDMLYRIGGDEFAFIFVETDIDKARVIGENICKRIEKNVVMGLDNITISIGISSFDFDDENDDEEKLFKRADDALYLSKERGRNRVSIIPETKILNIHNN